MVKDHGSGAGIEYRTRGHSLQPGPSCVTKVLLCCTTRRGCRGLRWLRLTAAQSEAQHKALGAEAVMPTSASADWATLYHEPYILEPFLAAQVYCPYLLINKKRYAGLLYTRPDKYDKMDSKARPQLPASYPSTPPHCMFRVQRQASPGLVPCCSLKHTYQSSIIHLFIPLQSAGYWVFM